MPRVTHVKRAQQRYRTIPVLDDLGAQVETLVRRRDGSPKTTKRGGQVFRRQVREDRTQPLPPHNCDACGKPIEVGTPYKWIKPKSGPYGGRQRNRHESCPPWQVWDYSDSLSAQASRIAFEAQNAFDQGVESKDDVESILNDAAEQIRELAEQKRESAGNIEDGFGHSTYVSDELNETADSLDSWADDVEGADVPDYPEFECDTCDSTGEVDCETCGGVETDGEKCPDCEDGVACCTECEGETEDPRPDQVDEWLDEAREALSVLDDCPV